MVSDEFDDESIGYWWVEDSDSTGNIEHTVILGDGTATLTLLRLYSDEKDIVTGRNGFYQDTTGDFDVAIKISEETVFQSSSSRGIGLMIYIDNDNYAYIRQSKYVIEYKYQYKIGGLSVGQSGVVSSMCTSLPPFYMRFKKVGNIYTPYYADNSGLYIDGPNATLLDANTVQIWLFACHSSGETQSKAEFEYCRNLV